MLIDAHCHLDHLSKEEAHDFLAHLTDKSLNCVITSAAREQDWAFYKELSSKHPGMKVCYGIHPLDISEHWETDLNTLEKYAAEAVAIGEIGLDFHGIFRQENVSIMKLQMKLFERQIRVAQKFNLPIVIHCREAFTILKEILIYTKFNLKQAMFHCFVEGIENAQWVIQQGGFLSYSGILTFKKPGHTVETAVIAPLDQILIETDSPYLAPTPLRGKINSPENVHWVAQKLAEIKNISYEECAKITAKNAQKFFNL